MKKRIENMMKDVMSGKVWAEMTEIPTEYDRCDLLLEPIEMSAKRVYEYMVNQVPRITEECALTGYFRWDWSVEGELFNRPGHKHFWELKELFYAKPLDNLVTLEWQHSTGNFKRVVDIGIDGIKELIAKSKETHTEKDEILFLNALDKVCDAMIAWANKCADCALAKAEETENPEYKNNLLKLSQTLRKIPQKPAETFYEAIECVYICHPFLTDSIGLIDRYLYRFYKNDIENGTLTEEDATAYLQELFLMLQAKKDPNATETFYRGGEAHFGIGGYLEDGSDGFNELSYLIVESLMEMDTAIPQISLRWTSKTPTEVLRYLMDCERKDKYKRIAFINDEPRIKAYMEILGYSYSEAVNYTMVGCNEPSMIGGRDLGITYQNILRCMSNTFKNRSEDIIAAKTFDEFYSVYESELFSDMEEMLKYEDAFTVAMERDCDIISSILLDGCIENAKSATRGGTKYGIPTLDFIGVSSTIDSLAVVQQFVFDEKRISMETLVDAINSNWQGYEDLRCEILKTGNFFGNDIDETTELSQRFTTSIYNYLSDKRHRFGQKYLVGNLIGYNEHHKWFGELTSATPDGRYDGDPMSYGVSQNDGRDREGLTALLSSIAKYDPNGIMTGPSVTNVLIDDKLVNDDEFFEKSVILFETYFKLGGTHFQLNYVSKEDMINAQKEPGKYKSLRVRVSGFSDFFVNLNENLQNELITRTVKKGA